MILCFLITNGLLTAGLASNQKIWNYLTLIGTIWAQSSFGINSDFSFS